MTWIRENKFLTGFFAVLLVGAGVLGYLLYSASGNFSEVSDNYNRQAAELKRLQNLKPYPDEGNLRKLVEQKEGYFLALSDLQKTLAALEFHVQPMTPEQFQDKLRASVSQAVEKAKTAGVKLPEKFYMGFENYQTSLPKPEAAGPLGRQLQAIEVVVNQALDAKIDELTSLSRSSLPEEIGPAPAGQNKLKPVANGPAANKLVDKTSFQMAFQAEQFRFRKWLNDVSSAKEQFYIIRLLAVNNSNPKPPSRLDASATGDTGAASGDSAAGAAGSPAPSSLKFVVGVEKVNVTARIDIVDFTPTAAAK